jgi:hypothetical protein
MNAAAFIRQLEGSDDAAARAALAELEAAARPSLLPGPCMPRAAPVRAQWEGEPGSERHARVTPNCYEYTETQG